jgi:hypothetical protein
MRLVIVIGDIINRQSPGLKAMPPRTRRLILWLPLFVLFAALVSTGIVVVHRYGVRARALQVIYDRRGIVETRAIGPEFLRDWVGLRAMEPLEPVIAVRFIFLREMFETLPNPEITDSDLAQIALFDELTELELVGTEATDAGLEQIARLTGLERLVLWGNVEINDAGIMKLDRLTNLRELDLKFVDSDGTGLLQLGGMSQLESLCLIRGVPEMIKIPVDVPVSLKALAQWPRLNKLAICPDQVGEEGVSEIAKLQYLRELELWRWRGDINDHQPKAEMPDLQNLAPLRSVRKLCLYGTGFTDRDIIRVAELQNLEELILDWSRKDDLTDAGLLHLERLSKLRVLEISQTSVTQAGIDELQHRLPNLKITADNNEADVE